MTSVDASLTTLQFALKSGRAKTAELGLRQWLQQRPGHPRAEWLLAVALLDQNCPQEARSILERLCAAVDVPSDVTVDRARCLRACGELSSARGHVRSVLSREAQHPRAWLAYADILVDLNQMDDARIAFERARECEPQRARIEIATARLLADDREAAEMHFRAVLQQDPAHVSALCGLAALSLGADMPRDAERLLRHALRQSAYVPLAWRGLGPALLELGRLSEAAQAAALLRRLEPENPQSWIATAASAARLLRQEEALEAYQVAARLKPTEVRLLTSIGHIHKTLGQRAQSEAAYKAAWALDPVNAEACWSLADLKNYRFTDEEVASMEERLADPAHDPAGEAQWHFALGKAYEQRADYTQSFQHYAKGNARRRRDSPFDGHAFDARAARIQAIFDAEFFAERSGVGDPSSSPIFVVGLPRSGSTLIEQILASHSAVEGTMELPNILNIVRDIDHRTPSRNGYPEAVPDIPVEEWASLGARYLSEIEPLRSGRCHFIDKLPNNFSHIGLIHTILPHARIIDARRHPMDCCLSAFKQHFAEGQTFSYDLTDLGRYYRTYLRLMSHWESVLPGVVLTVQYEALVADPEAQIRRLLTHCGLEFEASCLQFHATRRSVRTASAEQVRQPLYRSSIGYWRHFEAHLGPLREALAEPVALGD
jgi:cytochrome c-type biogenesis protein CcmH/NrfG